VLLLCYRVTQKGLVMKLLASLVVVLALTGCGTVKGTVGGFLEGVGQDATALGQKVKN
jgi:predicted small secreted protein